ncbi:MAG: type VI secretion system protein TssA [Thermodesulfobacteriota bacterium]|nr:type VI secretion system protein TssA [Thermodesulfobacteriota bacterium]
MELAELGKTPISDSSPAGEDVAYEPEFEELQQEIDKLSIATAGAGEVDWNKVEALSRTILAEKAKHLLVAVYLAKALIQNHEFDGLCDGTAVVKDVIENFWDNLYPPKKRKKGRINAIQWWMDQTDRFFQNFSPSPLPEEKVAALKTLMGELDTLLEDKLADDAPILRPLLQHVDRLPVASSEAAQPEEDTGSGEASPTAAAPSSGQAMDVPESIESDKDVNRTIKAVFTQINLVARYYRATDLSNPLSYRLNRLVAWLTIDELPLVQDDGNTLLPAPEGAIRSGIENQMTAGNYETVITTAEDQLRQSLFWFDLNRFTAQALEALGGKYAKAGDMVSAETALLIKRLPGLENLTFSDGTPFADNETRAWLKTLTAADETAEPMPGVTEGGLDARVKEVEAEAKDLFRKKERAEAVALLQTGMTGAGSCRERFLFRMALARLFMTMGKTDLTGPHLDEILSDVDTYALETWDPDLAVQGLMLAHENAVNEKNQEKGGEILNRIVKINPAAAFRMAGK